MRTVYSVLRNGRLGSLRVLPPQVHHQENHHQGANAAGNEDVRDHLMRLVRQVTKLV